MLKKILTITATIICVLTAYAQNGDNGRQNWFPNVGNVGVGTRTPVTDLEVIGSIKASDNIESATLNVVDLFGTDFIFSQNGSVGGNFHVGGNVGIGITDAQEKLHVIGNLKASQSLIAEILDVTTGNFSNDVGIGGNASIIGNTVISGLLGVGIENPEEKIHVLGNVKISQALLADSYTVRLGTITEDLQVNGNANVNGTITGGQLEIGGNTNLLGDLDVAGNSNVTQNAAFGGNVGIGVAPGTERLNVAGDIRATQGISSNSTSTANATVTEDLNVERNTFITNDLTVGGNSSVQGETTSGTLLVVTDSKIQGNEVIDGNISIGTLNATERVNVGGNVNVDGNLSVLDASLQSATISSDAAVEGNLGVDGNVAIGIATATEKVHVVGNVKVEGDLMADAVNLDSLTTTNLEAVDAHVSNDLDVDGNTEIGGNLGIDGNIGVGTKTPEEKVHVVGNVKIEGDLMADAVNMDSLVTDNVKTTTLTVENDADLNGNTDVAGNLTVGGALNTTEINADANLSIGSTGGITINSANDMSLNVNGNALNLENSGRISGLLDPTDLQDAATKNYADTRLAGQAISSVAQNPTSAQDRFAITWNESNASYDLLDIPQTTYGAANQIPFTNASGQDFAYSGNLTFDGNTIGTNNINVAQNLTAASIEATQFSTDQFNVNEELNVNTVTVTTQLNVSGNGNVIGELQVGSLNAPVSNLANATINNLKITGQIQGDLGLSGDLTANVISATEFRLPDGSSPFVNDDVVIENSLVVGTDRVVPEGFRVAIEGNVLATGVDVKIVEAWPDYVFEDEYELISIEELAKFIKKNGHLPNVPSASEMEEEGQYSLGSMDKLLLEKVEELTLYMIEQKEKNDRQEKLIEQQSLLIEKLIEKLEGIQEDSSK